MSDAWREFRQQGRRHTLVWKVKVVGNTVHYSHGVLGGKMQTASDTKKAVNVGKANEKSPEMVAREEADRLILKQRRSGYVEYVNDLPLEKLPTEVTWDAPPLSLRFWKPTNTLGKGLAKKLRAGKAWGARKRNGVAYPVVYDEWGSPKLYSRVMLPHHKDEPGVSWNRRFEHIIEELVDAAKRHRLPSRSIILGELVMDRRGLDDPVHVESVIKSLTPRALEQQAADGYLGYYVWGIGFWSGQPVCQTQTFGDQYRLIHDVFHDYDHLHPVDVYEPWEIQELCTRWYVDDPLEALIAEARDQEWEGWVVVDPDASMGSRGCNLRGKVERSATAAGKLKPIYEDDFIALWNPPDGEGSFGTGKNQGKCGAVALYQYDTSGTLVYICDAGSGIVDNNDPKRPDAPYRHLLSDPLNYPMVVEVQYQSRNYISAGGKTNALIIPSLVRIRSDKAPEECCNAKL